MKVIVVLAHYTECSGCSNTTGQMACYGSELGQCCNVYVNDWCADTCPFGGSTYGIDPDTFVCSKFALHCYTARIPWLYFNQQIWLSQLHVCSLNACMALNRYEECAKCIGNSLRHVWDMNDRIYDSALVTEHDIAVMAVNS